MEQLYFKKKILHNLKGSLNYYGNFALKMQVSTVKLDCVKASPDGERAELLHRVTEWLVAFCPTAYIQS